MKLHNQTLSGLLFTLLAGILLAACGHGDSQDGPSTGICEGICAKFELCDSSTDESDCVEECLIDQALSAAYWTGLSNCVEGSSCDELTNDLLADCVTDEVSRYHSATKTSQGACETMARTLEVCNKDLDEDGVLRNCMDTTAAYFSDSLMTTLENCFFGSCDEITNCVYRVLDNYDIEDLYDFFFESLGIYSENPDPAYECQSDNDCGSVEFCNLATNTCTPKDHNPSEDCDLNLECQDGWYCDMNTRRCMQNDCSLALGVFIEAIDEACHGRDLECCFCKCWNDERQIYSDYTYNSSGECVCGKGDVGWYENNCYGDYREEAQDCLADREACKTEESKIVLSNEFGLCTHTPL